MNNFSFLSMIRLALRHISVIIITSLVFAICTFSYCQFIAVPQYAAKGSVLVTNGAIINDISSTGEINSINSTDISASLILANTIVDILKNNDIYKELSDSIDNKYSYEQLKSRATIARRSENTLFIDVTFTASTPNEAISLVNTYLELSPSYVIKYIPNSTATVTTTADSAGKTFPKTYFSTFTMALLGAVLTFIMIYVINFFNNTIRDESDFKDNYDITIIGTIPDFATAKSKYYYKSYSKGDYSNGK